MTIKEMTKFLTFCKKIGLKRIKTEDFEADFSEIGLELKKDNMAPVSSGEISKGQEIESEPLPTEDDLLYYSSDYDPRENKAEHVSA
jgi:hypothetical protein